jgi:hypothetical protein
LDKDYVIRILKNQKDESAFGDPIGDYDSDATNNKPMSKETDLTN